MLDLKFFHGFSIFAYFGILRFFTVLEKSEFYNSAFWQSEFIVFSQIFL